MDFRSENKFNAIINILSGNFLPMTGEKTKLGFFRLTYMMIVWIIRLIYIITTGIGCFSYVPIMVAIRDGGVTGIVIVETIILWIYLNLRRDYLHNLIGKIESILVDSDDLRRIIRDTVEPNKNRMKIYTIATVGSVVLWAALPVLLVLEKNTFTYTDYVLPTYFPGEPFTVKTFVFGIIVDTIGGSYVIVNKNAIDIYVSYLITILTSEFRYVNEQITMILCGTNDEKDTDKMITSLRKCVEHHCIAIDIGQMLAKLLYLNVGVTYLNCILRFCLLGFALVATPGAYFAKCIYMLFTLGNLVQVYFLCSCVQELLEASTSITDDAFHEDWYGRGSAIRNMFQTMGLSNRIECRLTAFRIVDLTVPSFAAILNHAYSACLLLLRMNVSAHADD
nr:olfactory receptor 36 [Gregopimpla kuwanae]